MSCVNHTSLTTFDIARIIAPVRQLVRLRANFHFGENHAHDHPCCYCCHNAMSRFREAAKKIARATAHPASPPEHKAAMAQDITILAEQSTMIPKRVIEETTALLKKDPRLKHAYRVDAHTNKG
jgi:hypothetical protein